MKPNLLLLHGALGTKQQFDSIIPALQKIFTVHSINFSGHGDKPDKGAFTMDGFICDILEYLNKHNIENTHILGYSMGGYVALGLTTHYPTRVNRLITLGTKYEWTAAIAEKEIQHLNPDKIESKVPAFAEHLKLLHPANDWKQLILSTANFLHGLGAGKGLDAKKLSIIKNHVLVTRGSEDNMVNEEETKELANAIPNASLKTIEGFKHQLEKNDLSPLVKIASDFFGK